MGYYDMEEIVKEKERYVEDYLKHKNYKEVKKSFIRKLFEKLIKRYKNENII